LASSLGSYVNLTLLARGLRQRLGALYTPAMWVGTRRIFVAALVATLAGWIMRLLHHAAYPDLHPRIAGVPVLAVFAVVYLGTAWLFGSYEAARWLRLSPRVPRGPADG
jgi:peptidoglycan biosynthesis protein MviN/MurJ (putative lipid II flippase)